MRAVSRRATRRQEGLRAEMGFRELEVDAWHVGLPPQVRRGTEPEWGSQNRKSPPHPRTSEKRSIKSSSRR